MSPRAWATSAIAAGVVSAALTVAVVGMAQRHYVNVFALRIARTTAAYLAAVTPPPPPPAPTRRTRRRMGRTPAAPSPAPAAPSIAEQSYDLPALLTQARALRTLPGWTSDVEVFFGTAPLVDASASPLSPEDLRRIDSLGGELRGSVGIVPLKSRTGRQIVGAVAVRPHRLPRGPLPGGMGFVVPAAFISLATAIVVAVRRRSLKRGGYIAAAVLLAVAAYADVRNAAKQSTDRWLIDTRRLLQEAATRLPPPRSRVAVSDLAALVPDAEVAPGEPAEAAPQRVRINGELRAVAAVLIGPGRWVELRTVPEEERALRWLLLVLPSTLLGPLGILLLRWAEHTPAGTRRQSTVAWGFLAPGLAHVLIFTVAPAFYGLYLASPSRITVLVRDALTWTSMRNSLIYVLYVPVSVILALLAALAVHARRRRWSRHVLGAVFLLPYATSSVAIAILWQMILQSGSLAMGRIDWLSEPGTAVPALMVISLWAHVGGQMIVLLAGLERIPQPLLDAARVDGAGPWRCFWRVTFPLLRPVAALVTVTGVMGALQMFTLAFVLTPQNVIVSRAYRIAWGAQLFGLASALSVALLVVLLILRWPQQGLLRRRESHG